MTDELNPFVYDDPLPPDALIDRGRGDRKLLSLAEGATTHGSPRPGATGRRRSSYACSPKPTELGCTPCMSISIGA